MNDEEAFVILRDSLANQLKQDTSFMYVYSDITSALETTFKDNGLLTEIGRPGDPSISLIHVVGYDRPFIRYNINGILTNLIMAYGIKLFESPEIFDRLTMEHLDIVETFASEIIKHQGTHGWGTIAERAENVHDSSVNICYKKSYERIKKYNNVEYDGADLIVMNNIQSYFYEKSNAINFKMMEFARLMKAVEEMNTYIDDMMEKIKSHDGSIDASGYISRYESVLQESDKLKLLMEKHKKELPTIITNITNIQSCLFVLLQIETNNCFMVSMGDYEINILYEVWARIHSSRNKDNLESLLSMFESNLKSLVNANKLDNIECANGRVGALISTLEVYDSDNVVSIVCVPMLKKIIMEQKVPILISAYLNTIDEETRVNYKEKGISLPNTNLADLKAYLIENIKKEYDELAEYHVKIFVDEAMTYI